MAQSVVYTSSPALPVSGCALRLRTGCDWLGDVMSLKGDYAEAEVGSETAEGKMVALAVVECNGGGLEPSVIRFQIC